MFSHLRLTMIAFVFAAKTISAIAATPAGAGSPFTAVDAQSDVQNESPAANEIHQATTTTTVTDGAAGASSAGTERLADEHAAPTSDPTSARRADIEDTHADVRADSELKAQWEAAHAARDQATYAWWQIWIAVLGTVVATAGTGLLIYTIRLTHRSLAIAEESSRTALNAAKATEAGVAVAMESSRTQLRAYAHNEAIASRAEYRPDGTLAGEQIYVVWKNCGATPALRVRSAASAMAWTTGVLPPWFPFPDMPRLWGYETGDPSVLAAGTQITHNIATVPEQQIEEIIRNWRIIFCWGWMSYEDIYGQYHITKFCFRSRGASRRDDGTFAIEFAYYSGNNCIDDICVREDEARPAPPNEFLQYEQKFGRMGIYMWMDEQAPTTYERSPDWHPHDDRPRDQYGVRAPDPS
ncbi:hypothetical protein [Xanthobacter flavus]|uniref:hypothetical protein n=1 Tax=Xanthobacter flavus TaxID=281 RepID=UPI001AE88CF9|nr:hypothetical protein [Xanthobacter flavus]MBP2147972.1 hypothetical protein [Xanthobacter flavus]